MLPPSTAELWKRWTSFALPTLLNPLRRVDDAFFHPPLARPMFGLRANAPPKGAQRIEAGLIGLLCSAVPYTR